jgi:hypothetical protein
MSLAHLMLGKCEPEMFATATPAIPATQAGDAGRGVASRRECRNCRCRWSITRAGLQVSRFSERSRTCAVRGLRRVPTQKEM